MKNITVHHYAELLDRWSEDVSFDQVRPRLTALAKWMIDRGHAHWISKIEDAWSKLQIKRGQQLEVEIVTSRPLSADDRSNIIEALERKMGKKVFLRTSVDDGIIGGAKLRIVDRQWDASIAEQLHQLEQRLKR